MSPSCHAPRVSPMALSMRCSSGSTAEVAGLDEESSFFFFFCAEAGEARERVRRRNREKKKRRLAARRMFEGSFRNFIFDSLPKFWARFFFECGSRAAITGLLVSREVNAGAGRRGGMCSVGLREMAAIGNWHL